MQQTAEEAVRQLLLDLELTTFRAQELQKQLLRTPTDPAKAELLGVSEIAKIFGVHPATVSKWVQRGRLPEPLARLASGYVWNRAQIDAVELERTGFPLLPEPE